MKKMIMGASILLSGAILVVAVFSAAGSGISSLLGWGPHGRFWSAVGYYHLTPVLAAAAVMMVAGIVIMIANSSER